ncbi:hypothetical protein [Dyadobacter sp. Leaf189]|uniref:hypothetical protein n=1 Tax=Dyadobacter sp. Leaf189 TaxID=1736295 RepID=UPI0006FF61B5|nr:hypothetical protein [Dyadobacter sp. Leaf189]KQS28254.1 hypothetical protein ASG33_17935 [Dyadobacter sp. Leaf189]
MRGIWIVILSFLLVVAIRLCYVENYAVALPFWDQWDAEGDHLIRPWVEGTLKVSDLWNPHNEHRIFPTRLFSLMLFQITGQWNNLFSAKVNVVLAATIPTILLGFLYRFNGLNGRKWWILPFLIAQFTLPFSFENWLVGFQSQFYFLILFVVTAFGLSTAFPERASAQFLVFLLCFLSTLTTASGILTPLTVAGVYLLQWLSEPGNKIQYWILVAALTIMAIIGYFQIPHIAAHDMYRARNLSEWTHSLLLILSWPVGPHNWIAAPLWSPALITLAFLLKRNRLRKSDFFMAGCVMWSLTQAMAIAFGRGQELTALPSRYTELLSIGLVANAWFAIRFVEEYKVAKWYKYLILSIFPLFFHGHRKRFKSDMHDVQRVHRHSVVQTKNVVSYLQTNNPNYLRQPTMHIPYPDPVGLKQLLDNRTIITLLPPEIGSNSHFNAIGTKKEQ